MEVDRVLRNESLLQKYTILVALFMAAILVANTVATKLFDLGGFVMTAGIIAYPITFAVTDIVDEVWGRRAAVGVVIAGLFANVVMLLLYQIAIYLPAAGFWEGQGAFDSILGGVPRIVLASMVAYLISQTTDVYVFQWIKQKLSFGLWLRNNVSTFLSQTIDSAVFLFIAFYGVMDGSHLFEMFVTYVAVKWIIALVDTPLVYLGVHWVQKGRV